MIVLYGVAFSWMTLALAARARSVEDLALLNSVFLMMLFLNVDFVPIEGFPGFLQPIVRQMPHTRAVEARLGLAQGGPVLLPLAWTLLWVTLLTAVFAPLAVRRLGHG